MAMYAQKMILTAVALLSFNFSVQAGRSPYEIQRIEDIVQKVNRSNQLSKEDIKLLKSALRGIKKAEGEKYIQGLAPDEVAVSPEIAHCIKRFTKPHKG